MRRKPMGWKVWAFLGAVAGGAWLLLRPKTAAALPQAPPPAGSTDAAKTPAPAAATPHNVTTLTHGVRYYFAPQAAQANPSFFSQFKGRWQLTNNPFLVSNVWQGPSDAVVPAGVLISTAP